MDDAGFEGKEGMVPADADMGSGEDFVTALAHDNGPRLGGGAMGELDAEIFGLRVAEVFSRAAGFLCCHI